MKLLRSAVLFLLAACSPSAPEVVVYTSVDEIYARGIFAAFERESGVRVRAVYDAEEAKSLGLVHRLAAEAGDPRADVFWNGEAVRTALLARKGLLEAFRPESARDIGPGWRDPDGYWTGFGARVRVIVYRPDRVKRPPETFDELASPEWRGRVAAANPLFGTTAAHVAALAQARGEEETLRWLAALKANGVRWVGGNSHVRDLVARGDCDLGITDSDDVWIGLDRGDPIAMKVPAGTLAIPNTAALIRGAPHAEEGKRFLEFLLRRSTEELLAKGRSRQMPVRGPAMEAMNVDWAALAESEPFLGRVRRLLDL